MHYVRMSSDTRNAHTHVVPRAGHGMAAATAFLRDAPLFSLQCSRLPAEKSSVCHGPWHMR